MAHARAANSHERVGYIVADLANDDGPLRSERFQVATSTMALHWPGPDPLVCWPASLPRFIEPGGVFLAGSMVPGRVKKGSTPSKKSRAWTWRASHG